MARKQAMTFMAAVPQDLNDRVTLQKFQQILIQLQRHMMALQYLIDYNIVVRKVPQKT